MLKKIFCLVLAAVLCCTPVLAAPAPTHTVNAKAAILYEVSTDTVLMEQDADMKLFPASTTKLMTALVALEYGNPDDTVTVTSTGRLKGATITTHLYDAMGCCHGNDSWKNTGTIQESVAAACLVCPELTYEIIPDSRGVHVKPTEMQLKL